MPTILEEIELFPTLETCSVRSHFLPGGNNHARLEYRRVGDSTWIEAPCVEGFCPYCGGKNTYQVSPGMWTCPDCSATWPMRTLVADRRVNISDYWSALIPPGEPGEDSNYPPNPYVNQWRAVIYFLEPDTDYEVRVTYTDPEGITGPASHSGIVHTWTDNPLCTGRDIYVALTGNDGNNGLSLVSAKRTLQAAADMSIPGDHIWILPGVYIDTSSGYYGQNAAVENSGMPDNWIIYESYDPNDQAVIDGLDSINCHIRLANVSYVAIRNLKLHNLGVDGRAKGIDFWSETANVHDIIVDNVEIIYHGGEISALYLRDRLDGYHMPVYNVLIQNCYIWADDPDITGYNVKFGIYSEGYRNHGIVLKNNVFTSPNLSVRDMTSGHWHSDTFFYGNRIDGARYDVVEMDGEGLNCGVWSNIIGPAPITLSGTMHQLSTVPCVVGPLYIFRNIMGGSWDGVVKMGNSSTGWMFFFHNTLVNDRDEPNNKIALASYGNNNLLTNFIMRNNILVTRRHRCYFGAITTSVANDAPWSTEADWLNFDWDYNLWAGGIMRYFGVDYYTLAGFQAATGMEPHGIDGNLHDVMFVNHDAYDYRLQEGSPARNAGVILPGWNDEKSPWPWKDIGPDLGAIEMGGDAPIPPPVAALSASVVEGEAPLTVILTDLSTGAVDSWEWDFGDGETSDQPVVSHVFTAPDDYTVTLTVTGPGGTDSDQMVISVSAPPVEYLLTIETTSGGNTDPLPGTYSYDEDTPVEIQANPDTDYIFSHWSDGNTANPRTVVMNQDISLTAYFEEKEEPPPPDEGASLVKIATWTTIVAGVITAVKRARG